MDAVRRGGKSAAGGSLRILLLERHYIKHFPKKEVLTCQIWKIFFLNSGRADFDPFFNEKGPAVLRDRRAPL